MAPVHRVYVIGAGGHAAVVIATCQDAGFEVAGAFDDDASLEGTRVLGVPVLGPIERADIADGSWVVAIGDNTLRMQVARRLEATPATIVHPTAYVHPTVSLGPGTVVFAGAVLQPRTAVGSPRHHQHARLSRPRLRRSATLPTSGRAPPCSGGTRIGEGVLLGSGSSSIPQASVGEWTRVGAGATVVGTLPAHVTAVGVPARVVR